MAHNCCSKDKGKGKASGSRVHKAQIEEVVEDEDNKEEESSSQEENPPSYSKGDLHAAVARLGASEKEELLEQLSLEGF